MYSQLVWAATVLERHTGIRGLVSIARSGGWSDGKAESIVDAAILLEEAVRAALDAINMEDE